MPIYAQIIVPIAALILGWVIRRLYAGYQLSSVERRAELLKRDAVKEAETKKKELLLDAQDQIVRERKQQDRELRERRTEIQRLESRLILKEDNLDKKSQSLDRDRTRLAASEKELEDKIEAADIIAAKLTSELEVVAGLSAQEAKALIIESMETEARAEARTLVNKIEVEAREGAERNARDVLATVVQRMASEVSGDITVTGVSLPNDEMKGRIIGREGRNIRALETLTGVDIIIDDTPESVVISAYDPVRKAIAKESLERLVVDGRIHPTRIEEVVQKVTKEIDRKIYEEGERAVFDFGIHNMNPEGVRALGRLHFRTSYGQNILDHSREMASLAVMLASELGADRDIAKRAALLHDVGKGIQTEGDANHAEIGAELCKKIGESPEVTHAVLAHHNDVEPRTIEAVIVQIADAISAARPGARRESLDNYIKRLESLERIANEYKGVERAFAIQAGRELRVIVNSEEVSDDAVRDVGREIALRIESELKYPGRIRITLVRETRVVEYAR